MRLTMRLAIELAELRGLATMAALAVPYCLCTLRTKVIEVPAVPQVSIVSGLSGDNFMAAGWSIVEARFALKRLVASLPIFQEDYGFGWEVVHQVYRRAYPSKRRG